VHIDLLLTALLLAFLPGPGAIYTLSAATSSGLRAGLPAAAGCAAGALPYFALSTAPTAGAAFAHPAVTGALTGAGVLYLVYLAVRTWRTGQERLSPSVRDDQRMWRRVGQGAVVNLLNPKLSLVFFVLLPGSAGDTGPAGAALGAAFVGVILVAYVLYAVAGSFLGRGLVKNAKSRTWASRVFASTYALLAARLAFSFA
jgi:threonine/homoserine/homoserine lactone efflux protein